MIELVLATVGEEFGEEPMLSAPFAVETVQLRPLAKGELAYAPTNRWQCLIGAEHPTAAVDLGVEGDEYFVTSINRGELAMRFNRAVSVAEKELRDSEFLLSQIEIPGLHMAAARLVDTTTRNELFIPVLPLPGNEELQPMRVYDPERLTTVLQADAEMGMGTGMGTV